MDLSRDDQPQACIPGGDSTATTMWPKSGTGGSNVPSSLSGDGSNTDKVCDNCRSRKLKCDSNKPRCTSCTDSDERCEWGGNVAPAEAPQTLPPVSEQSRIFALEGSVAALRSALLSTRDAPAKLGTLPLPTHLVDSIRTSFFEGTPPSFANESETFLRAHVTDLSGEGERVPLGSMGESSIGGQIAELGLSRLLCLHLINAFFASSCAELPLFKLHPFSDRLQFICDNLDQLDPTAQLSVFAFCALGARATPHSSVFGIPVTSPADAIPSEWAISTGTRREQACRALQARTLDLCYALEIVFQPSVANLELLLVAVQMLIFNEIGVPKKARALLLLAIGQFRDLQQDPLVPTELKEDLVRRLSIPLITCDARLSSYARRSPAVSPSDALQYFATLILPDFSTDNLRRNLGRFIPAHVAQLTHEAIVASTQEVDCWLAQARRRFAQLSVQHQAPPSIIFAEIQILWGALDQIHEAVQLLQQLLINLDRTPYNCGTGSCSDPDLHLRFVTRLDRDTMDVTLLLHSLIKANLELHGLRTQLGAAMLPESERRVRKVLRLIAFYSELYLASGDHDMMYHLFCQFELLPNWTTMALQRCGEVGGPASPELEVTDVELDWFVKGLSCACFYHPGAKVRLDELRVGRHPLKHESLPRAEVDVSGPSLC